ncbi:MAG: glycosyltransferase family 4 protein [Patescibacteria group bacterium]|nr:glycosyltransferase family 4 protein [Patescibacteria group bacterium]
MRIGIDLRTLQQGRTTGVEVYSQNLIQALLNIKSPDKYLLFYNSHHRPVPRLSFAGGNDITLKTFRLPNRLLNLSFLFLHYPKIDRLLGGLDIFFSPRYLFSAFSARCRLVVVMHDLSFVHFPHFFSWKQRLWHSFVSDRSACKRASTVIAVSKSTRDDLIETFQIEKSKISVVYPGLDHRLYHSRCDANEENKFRLEYGLSKPFVLYLGTIEPRKNILGIIRAFELVKAKCDAPLELVLAGGLGWLYKKILRRLDRSPYRQSIKLLGRVPETAKAPLYRMAKVVLFPSFFEGFGFPPLEALACGTPVVVAHNSSFHEVLEDAAIYVNPYDAAQIAMSLKALLRDEALARHCVDLGLRRAKDFTWEKTAAGVLEVFQKLSPEKIV